MITLSFSGLLHKLKRRPANLEAVGIVAAEIFNIEDIDSISLFMDGKELLNYEDISNDARIEIMVEEIADTIKRSRESSSNNIVINKKVKTTKVSFQSKLIATRNDSVEVEDDLIEDNSRMNDLRTPSPNPFSNPTLNKLPDRPNSLPKGFSRV